MIVCAQPFVTKSELFDGLPTLKARFWEDDHPFTWGDCSRSMIAPRLFYEWLDDSIDEPCGEEDELRNRLDGLATNVLVDLQN